MVVLLCPISLIFNYYNLTEIKELRRSVMSATILHANEYVGKWDIRSQVSILVYGDHFDQIALVLSSERGIKTLTLDRVNPYFNDWVKFMKDKPRTINIGFSRSGDSLRPEDHLRPGQYQDKS